VGEREREREEREREREREIFPESESQGIEESESEPASGSQRISEKEPGDQIARVTELEGQEQRPSQRTMVRSLSNIISENSESQRAQTQTQYRLAVSCQGWCRCTSSMRLQASREACRSAAKMI
jgi:hypothetical protein